MMSMQMQMCRESDWLTVCSIQGEIDVTNGSELRDAVAEALAQGQCWLLMDLLGAEYMDSVALGIMIGAAKEASQHGGALAVACSRPNLVKLFEVTGTRELLNVQESRQAACDLLAAARAACARPQDGGE